MLSPEPGSLHIWVELAVCGEHPRKVPGWRAPGHPSSFLIAPSGLWLLVGLCFWEGGGFIPGVLEGS